MHECSKVTLMKSMQVVWHHSLTPLYISGRLFESKKGIDTIKYHT